MLNRRHRDSPESSRLLYKVLSLLLQYPDTRLSSARDGILAAVAELPASSHRAAIARFCEYWTHTPSTALAQAYVETFDLRKHSGLYLSYYLYGDTRKRGMALLRLKHLYRLAGLILEDGEMPDYLPVMLEFAACAPSGIGERVLGDYRTAIALVHRSLAEMSSPYAPLVGVVCSSLPKLTAMQRDLLAELMANGPPSEQVGLAPYGPPETMYAGEA
jgi:nitrate reductase delta subunit